MAPVSNRVLVCMNRFQGYEKTIPDALDQLGYQAQWSDARPGNGFLVKFLTRLGLLQRIAFISRANVDRIVADAREFKADTVLLISPENLRAAELHSVRSALPGARLILYFFDSSANRHLDQEMIDAVDEAYSFDLDDCDRFDRLGFVPLFHHNEAYAKPVSAAEDPAYDYCFIGTGRVRRVKLLAGIAKKARERGAEFFFYLYAPSLLQYVLFRAFARFYGYDGILSRQSLSFETYLHMLGRSACVIDIEQQDQGGLTIRTMDAVFAGRPLATSNSNIKRHDFFAHFPITVFSDKTLDVSIPERINSTKSDELFHKYHILNWLRTLLTGDLPEYRVDDKMDVSSRAAQNIRMVEMAADKPI